MMKSIARSLLVVASTFMAGGSLAQNNLSDCNKLASIIAAGESINFSNSDFEAMKYFANCEVKSGASDAGLSIAYGAFSLGGNFSEQERNEYCSKSKEEYKIESTVYNKTKIVFESAFSVINSCINSTSKGWKINYDQVHQDAVSINLSNTNSTGGNLLGIDLIPLESLICTGVPEKFPVNVTTTSPVSMLCTRKVSSQLINGVLISTAPSVTVNIRLDDNQIPIRLSAYNSSIIEQMKAEIVQINQNFSGIKESFEGTKTSLQTWDDAVQSGNTVVAPYGSGTVNCPPGHYVVGLNVVGNTASGHCIGCLHTITPVCRLLNVD